MPKDGNPEEDITGKLLLILAFFSSYAYLVSLKNGYFHLKTFISNVVKVIATCCVHVFLVLSLTE